MYRQMVNWLMKNTYNVYIIDYILSDNQQLPTPTTTYKVNIYILGILIVAYHENQIDFSILCTSKYPHEWQVYLTPELILNRLVGCGPLNIFRFRIKFWYYIMGEIFNVKKRIEWRYFYFYTDFKKWMCFLLGKEDPADICMGHGPLSRDSQQKLINCNCKYKSLETSNCSNMYALLLQVIQFTIRCLDKCDVLPSFVLSSDSIAIIF